MTNILSFPSLAVFALVASGSNAATIHMLPSGTFDYGAVNLQPEGSNVALQAVSEIRPDGSEYRACVMSTFKDGLAEATPGYIHDARLEQGLKPLDAMEINKIIPSSIVDRDEYIVDAAYIVVSDSNDGEDFVRISVGAPQKEEARIFIGDTELSSDLFIYEESARYGHPDRPEEAYTIKIEDAAMIQQIKDALAAKEAIRVIPRTILSDYVFDYTFQGNTDLTQAFADCLTDLEDMHITRDTQPSWIIGNSFSDDILDVMILAAMMEDEDALANPELYQIAGVLGSTGMFAIGADVLQELSDGGVIETSMGEYISQNNLTGVYTVSPDILEHFGNDNNSCGCKITITFKPTPSDPPPYTFTPNVPGTIITSGLFDVNSGNPGTPFTPTGTPNNPTTPNDPPTPIPLPPAGVLLAGALGVLFRRKIVNSDLAISSQMYAGAALSVIGNRLQGHDADMSDDFSRGEVFVPQSV